MQVKLESYCKSAGEVGCSLDVAGVSGNGEEEIRDILKGKCNGT